LNFPLFDTHLCFVGHTHVQLFIREEEAMANVTPRHTVDGETIDLSEGRFIINPGSVGQPRDGDGRAAFAIYEPDRARLTFHRIAYPIEETQEQMREQGLPESLINRLPHGI